jgi:mono/diheme cytochrome c family protein
MSLNRGPFGLAGASLLAVTLAFACGAPLASSLGADRDPTNPEDGDGAGSANSAASSGQSTAGLPCAVSDVLSKACRTCHDSTPASGASAPLVTLADLQKDMNGKKVYDMVEQRIHAETGRMPPAARLTDDQIAAIDDWVRGGAKQSSEKCGDTPPPPPATQPFNCAAPAKTTVIKASTPFAWTDPNETDQYVCFGFDETTSSKRHAIAMGPMVQNPSIVHHILLFQNNESVSPEPVKCSAATAGSWKLVAGWAPGGTNFELPPEAGLPVDSTTHWVMQIHYNNARALQNQTDNSGFQLCETDQLRPNDAGVLAFGSMDFTIPPRISAFTVQCDYTLDSRYQGVKFFAPDPHMHKLGTSIGTQRIPGGNGTPEMVFEQNPFNFENQQNFKIDKPVSPGDVMRTRCTWANTTDQAVSFGENTSDEMCFNFLAYYPAIPDRSLGMVPLQTWVTPSLHIPLLGGPDCTTSQ